MIILYIPGSALNTLYLFYLIGLAAVTAISAWIIGVQMRRRIKKDLGRAVDDSDLVSLETWMKVGEVEEKKNPGRDWAPNSVDLGPDDHRRLDLFPKKKNNDRWFSRWP